MYLKPKRFPTDPKMTIDYKPNDKRKPGSQSAWVTKAVVGNCSLWRFNKD